MLTRDWNPGFEKPGARGNPDILPNPKPGFGQSAKPAGFGFPFLHQERCWRRWQISRCGDKNWSGGVYESSGAQFAAPMQLGHGVRWNILSYAVIRPTCCLSLQPHWSWAGLFCGGNFVHENPLSPWRRCVRRRFPVDWVDLKLIGL